MTTTYNYTEQCSRSYIQFPYFQRDKVGSSASHGKRKWHKNYSREPFPPGLHKWGRAYFLCALACNHHYPKSFRVFTHFSYRLVKNWTPRSIEGSETVVPTFSSTLCIGNFLHFMNYWYLSCLFKDEQTGQLYKKKRI